ncbi:hypothetical protein IJI72_00370 [Candidatus Saccharibacteria bacterium]|nr:hypothetical protein [Candidatus Saccharibacteria bacterium]
MKVLRFSAIYIGLVLGCVSCGLWRGEVRAVTYFGDGSTGVNAGSCAGGADDCYNGRTWVHYKYNEGASGATTVGTAYSFNYNGRNAYYTVTSPIVGSEISADCIGKGGFWHLEYRSTVIDNYDTKVAFGSAPIGALYQGAEYYGDVIGVAPGNYDASKVTPDAYGTTLDEVRALYDAWREETDPTVDVMFSSGSTRTWFCGDTGEPTPDEAEITLSGVSRVGLLNRGTSTVNKLTTITGALGVEPTKDNHSEIEARLNFGYANETFKASFKHYLKYTGSLPDWLENEIKPTFKVKKCTGAECDGGTASEIASGTLAHALTSSYKTANTSNQQMALAGTKGKYVKICEWVEYPSSLTYSSEESGGRKGKIVATGATVSSEKACAIIRNPDWQGETSAAGTREINVVGETPKWADFATDSGGAGAVWSPTQNEYVMRSVEATARFKHAMTRTDSGFNEENPGMVSDINGEQTRVIASTPALSSWNVTTKYKGIARVETDESHDIRPQGGNATTGLFTTGAIAAPGWTSGASASTTWKTARYDDTAAAGGTTENGWTTMTFGRDSGSWLGVLAGDEKEFAQKVYNSSKTWTLGYTDNFLEEAYCSNVYATGSCTAIATGGERYYINTTRNATSLSENTSSNAMSAERVEKIRRDYNFDIISLLPAGEADETMAAGEKFSVSFEGKIRKDAGWDAIDVSYYGFEPLNRRYITGTGEDEKLTVITYVVKNRGAGTDEADAYLGKIREAAVGYTTGTTDYRADYCQFFREKLGDYVDNCTMSGDDNRFAYTGVTGASGHNWVQTAVEADAGYSGTFNMADLEVPNLTPGAKFCVALGASKKSSTNSNAVISASFCTNVVKKPSVHVWGGSVSAGGDIKTSITSVAPDGGGKRPYGSWTDLGIIAAGTVNKMASGRTSATGTTMSEFGTIPCNNGSGAENWYSPLTIANVDCSNTAPYVGGAGFTSETDIYSKMKAKYIDGKIAGTDYTTNVANAAELARGNGVGGVSGGGGAKVVYCDETCEIGEDIIADGSYTSLADIPQVIIIAKNIYIYEGVKRVDAWLVASETVNTCTYRDGGRLKPYVQGDATAAHQLNASVCTERLIINGPVVGGTLDLTRTHGADNASVIAGTSSSQVAEEAERTTLSGTSLLFAENEAQIGEPSTTFLKKMPTRY